MAAIWYYVDRAQTRQGPVEADVLVQAHARGEVDDTSLAWREGLAQWSPLGQFRDELGLSPSPVLPHIAAPGPPPGYVHAYPGDAPKKKRSGCMIAAIVLGGVAVLAIPVLAILAAIALPAYQDYMLRTKVMSAVIEARALQPEVDAFVSNTDRCPRDAAELGAAPSTQPIVAEISIGEGDNGMCMIELELAATPGAPQLAGERIRLSRDVEGNWYCTSAMAKRVTLPSECR